MEQHKSPVMPLPHLVTNNKGLDPSKNVQYISVSKMAAKLQPVKVKVIVGSTNLWATGTHCTFLETSEPLLFSIKWVKHGRTFKAYNLL